MEQLCSETLGDGIKAFSSTSDIGVDTSSSGSSSFSQGTGNWADYADGNFMIRLLIDGGEGGGCGNARRGGRYDACLGYTAPSPRRPTSERMPSAA